MQIAGRISRLETKMGLRGACRVCGSYPPLRFALPGRDAEFPPCPGCGLGPQVVRILVRQPTAGATA